MDGTRQSHILPPHLAQWTGQAEYFKISTGGALLPMAGEARTWRVDRVSLPPCLPRQRPSNTNPTAPQQVL